MQLRMPGRKNVFAAAVFLLFCYFMLWELNFYLAETIKTTWYMMAVPVLTGGVLYFRGLRDGPEFRLLLAYWLWVWLSRALNGAPFLQYDFQLFFDLGLMFPFFALGMALDAAGRRRFLNWLSAAAGAYYFLLGLVCLMAFLQRRMFLNPITEGSIGLVPSAGGFQRINILDTNPDTSAYWFMMPLFLMVYQFFTCRRKLWRVPIALASLVYFAVISITYTRSVMLATATGLALLVVLLTDRALRSSGRGLRVCVLLLSFLLSLVLFYKLSDTCAAGLSRLSYTLYPVETVAPAESSAPAAAESEDPAAPAPESAAVRRPANRAAITQLPGLWGKLDVLSTRRLTVWYSALLALRDDPSVLWKGQFVKDMMVVSNTYTPHKPPHYHNVPVQVLMFTGLPGLLLILAVLILLLVRGFRLLFSRDPHADLAVKCLFLPVAASLVYYMLEIGIFTRCDVRPLYFYLICGMMLGWYYELYPRR